MAPTKTLRCFRQSRCLLYLLLVTLYLHSGTTFPLFDEATRSGGTSSFSSDPESWLRSAARDWMSSLPDDTYLNKLSIPGTHDSGALFGSFLCETQTWTIAKQLDAGIRYLDIRNRRTKKAFAIHHEFCFQRMMFGDVLKQVRDFLAAHPGETILMRVKEEYRPEEGSWPFERIWQRYMKTDSHLFVGDLNDRIPTLGEVRGKVLVLRDATFGGYGIRFRGNATDLQDFYKVYISFKDNPNGPDTVSLRQKQRAIRDYLQKARSSPIIVLNHLSGAGGLTPRMVARVTNNDGYDEIGPYKGPKTTGVVITDFPGDKLIYRVLKTNFLSPVLCPKKRWRANSDRTFAEFRMPKSPAGTVITIEEGSYARFGFPSCHRAKWTDLRFSCLESAQWKVSGSWDADGWCNSRNTQQPYLVVGNK